MPGSVAFASEMSQLGTCIKTLTRVWEGGWAHGDHIQYLLQMQDDISTQDVIKMKIFAAVDPKFRMPSRSWVSLMQMDGPYVQTALPA